MKTEILQFSGFKGINLPAVIWKPEGEIKAVLQVTHGMTEHMGRYERFAADLCSQGVAVAGFISSFKRYALKRKVLCSPLPACCSVLEIGTETAIL